MRILVIEDDKDLNQNLKQALSSAGFAVDSATNGVDGEHLGNEIEYDAVILDLGLPQRSGLEVLGNWRARDNRVPVLILTARDAWQEKVAGFKAGADDYLAKPFHMEELLARLDALLRRAYNQGAQILQAGTLRLDMDTQCAHQDDQVIQLTGTEFRLLRYLMLHPDQILSKSRLTEHVYEYDADKDSNVVEVYVNRLRQKLGKEYIHTRRGQGYIFRVPA